MKLTSAHPNRHLLRVLSQNKTVNEVDLYLVEMIVSSQKRKQKMDLYTSFKKTLQMKPDCMGAS